MTKRKMITNHDDPPPMGRRRSPRFQHSNDGVDEPVSFTKRRSSRSRSGVDFSMYAYKPDNEDVTSLPAVKVEDPKSFIQTIDAPKTPSPQKEKKVVKRKKSTPRRSRIVPGSLKPPADWTDVYSLVEELRADRSAPVDSDGAAAVPERDRGMKVFRFQVLIALMLSSQTKDAVVGDAMRKLQKHGLDVENIRATSDKELNGLIFSVGFRNNKTKFIKQSAELILSDYNGDIPPTAEKLMELPGVGPKMAYIVEHIAWGNVSGIGVDVHMHRMFNQLKWVDSTASTPEKTREQMEGWLPKEKWGEINALWVGLGQEVQQQKEKVLLKAIKSSRPKDAINLLKRLGMNCKSVAKKYGLESLLEDAMSKDKLSILNEINNAE